MVSLDHIAIWTDRRDHLLAALGAATGLGGMDGYASGGHVVAQGVRFANGPFLDVHQVNSPTPDAGQPFHRLIGLCGDIDQVEGEVMAAGLRVKASRRREAAHPEREAPWDLLSFRKGQGLASQLFVIAYHQGAQTSQDFAGPLYDPAGREAGSARLSRVWLPEADLDAAHAVLAALQIPPLGPAQSQQPPYGGLAFDLGSTQLVLAQPWGPPSAVRLDIHVKRETSEGLSPLPEITVVLNETA